MVTVLGLRGARAAGTLLGAAALAGIVGASLAHSWLGVFAGDWWAEAGVLGLTVLAIGAAIAGLAALIGKPGIGVGALTMILLGNPFSGVASAPELLPAPVGALGQWLPGRGRLRPALGRLLRRRGRGLGAARPRRVGGRRADGTAHRRPTGQGGERADRRPGGRTGAGGLTPYSYSRVSPP